MGETLSAGLMQFDKPALLEKRIKLLEAILDCGSISTAAKRVGLSYKTAWEAIDTMNNLSQTPLVIRTTGGSGGGGTTLTPFGKEMIENYTLLKSEYERFIHNLSSISTLNIEHIKHLKRMSMQISARNQLMGKVAHIKHGTVSAEVSMVLKSGTTLISNITHSAIEELNLCVGDEVVGIIKASSVLLTTTLDIATSARNKLTGLVCDVKRGEINSQVSLDIGDGDVITATITTESLESLALDVNQKICALIKSSSILIGK
ncbi:TOBE domain-containing protein [Sulfurospirillum barnesii]|uniref:ModE molybdate transport repressor domain/molybdenum-pterin binding domain protein n=1 Tax=Sulfurospirillum barnesii (strain ATCC 700032 / DSM 10660 / SES-3) TaxID=760154 RepID=I3XZW3_SULBS|nr:TOBE domain-containing protein [Sulfurospirillum barnesii]AFL69487.1 ModE molybdate transport repressor domain/molybdenum-pterin binding domain protein [Sulfurospirillum barnesii SES-3]